jgi:methionine biosynthesis protein MetW
LPNFGHWQLRLRLLLSGHVPASRDVPYRWYDTPATRLLTIEDFRSFCSERRIRVEQEVFLSGTGQRRHTWPNLFAETGIFVLSGRVPPRGDAAGRSVAR